MAETIKKEVKKTNEEKLVKIKIPKKNKDDDSEFVSVNEKTFQIKKGIVVEVPECVAEVLRNAELMQEEAYEFETDKSLAK